MSILRLNETDDDEVTEVQTVAPVVEPPKLFACPDCNHSCSTTAECCPSCGRYFRHYARTFEVIPGGGWVAKVAWGIVVSSFLWGAILVTLFVVGVVLLVVLAALAGVGGAYIPSRP